MRHIYYKYAPISLAIALMTSCASKKAVTDASLSPTTTKTETPTTTARDGIRLLQRVTDNKVYATDILADVDFSLVVNGNKISCPAKLSMRKDACIRLQLLMPILRTELARLEFTPDYVLILDRYHKEYVKASYSDVSFLANNGISYYSLQALFWNQLMLPGAKQVADGDLKKFDVDMTATPSVPVTLTNGNITYKWDVNTSSALIEKAEATYRGVNNGAPSLTWTYADFKALGTKKFPMRQQFGFAMGGKTAQVNLGLSSIKNKSDWDTKTEVSAKYRKVEVDELLQKIASMQ